MQVVELERCGPVAGKDHLADFDGRFVLPMEETEAAVIGRFNRALADKNAIELDVRAGPLLADIRDLARAAAELLSQEPNEPKPGDSADAWLDWRDAEQHRTGRRISMPRIVELSERTIKLDTLKKRSAERRQKNDETDDAPNAP